MVRKIGKSLEIFKRCHVGLAAFQLQKVPTPTNAAGVFQSLTNHKHQTRAGADTNEAPTVERVSIWHYQPHPTTNGSSRASDAFD